MRLRLQRLLILFIVVIYLISLLYKIGYVQKPWYDEVFMSDISRSMLLENSLNSNIKLISPVKVMTYGPVYFYFQKYILSLIGYGMFQYRLLNLISGLILIVLFAFQLSRLKLKREYIILYVALVAFNFSYVSNLCSGRMDLFAVMLYLLGLILFANNKRNSVSILRLSIVLVAGIITALSYLSTPRVGFYLLIYPLSLICEQFTVTKKRRNILYYLIFGLGFIVPILIYINDQFGGISSYIAFYHNMERFYGASDITKMNKAISIPLLFWVFSFILLAKNPRKFADPMLLSIMIIPAIHLLFIKQDGPYFPMMFPFMYATIVLMLNEYNKKILSVIPVSIVIFSLLTFSSSTVSNFAYFDVTNPKLIHEFVRSHSIRNETVLGNFEYYYVLKSFNNDFKSVYLLELKNQLSQQILDDYEIKKAMLSEEYYARNKDKIDDLGFTTVYTFEPTTGKKGLLSFLKKISRNQRIGYNCVFLVRK